MLLSTRFGSTDDSRSVRHKAEEMAILLSAGCRLALGSRQTIRIGSIYRQSEDGKRDTFVSIEPAIMHCRAIPLGTKITRKDGTVEESHPADPLAKWLPLGLSNDRVAKVLRMLDLGTLDWVNLYRIYEIILKDVGGTNGITGPGWATKSSLESFKRTANSPGAIGLEARHGTESTQPPSMPMSISEARLLIKSIVLAWLRAYE